MKIKKLNSAVLYYFLFYNCEYILILIKDFL